MPNLRDKLAINSPMVVTLKKRGKAYPDSYNAGQMNYMYTFANAGVDYVYYAKEYEEQQLNVFEVGDNLQVVKNQGPGEAYPTVVWTPSTGAEARSAAVPNVSTYDENAFKKKQEEREEESHRKSVEIGLRGLMQAHIASGKDNEEAMKLALEADYLVRKAAMEQTLF